MQDAETRRAEAKLENIKQQYLRVVRVIIEEQQQTGPLMQRVRSLLELAVCWRAIDLPKFSATARQRWEYPSS